MTSVPMKKRVSSTKVSSDNNCVCQNDSCNCLTNELNSDDIESVNNYSPSEIDCQLLTNLTLKENNPDMFDNSCKHKQQETIESEKRILSENEMNIYDDMFRSIDEYGPSTSTALPYKKTNGDKQSEDGIELEKGVETSRNDYDCSLYQHIAGRSTPIDDHLINNLERKLQNHKAGFLSLNLVVTDIDEENETNIQNEIKNKNQNLIRKKFLESDDQIINQIFSQTITSAGVTPTDEYENFVFEYEKTGVGDEYNNEPNNGNDNITSECDFNACNGTYSSITNNVGTSNNSINCMSSTSTHDQSSLTENLDNYIENTEENNSILQLSSYLDEDFTIDIDIKKEETPIPDDCEKKIAIKSLVEKQRPSIFVELYDDTEKDPTEPCYVEPITPKSIKSFFVDENGVNEVIGDESDLNDEEVKIECSGNTEIELTDIEIYKSVSNDNQSLHKNGNVININDHVYVNNDGPVTSDSDETENYNDSNGDLENDDGYIDDYDEVDENDEHNENYNTNKMHSSTVEQQEVVESESKTKVTRQIVSSSKRSVTSSSTSTIKGSIIVENNIATAIGNNDTIKTSLQNNGCSQINKKYESEQIVDDTTLESENLAGKKVKKSKKKLVKNDKENNIGSEDNTGDNTNGDMKEKRKKSKKSKKLNNPENEHISVKQNDSESGISLLLKRINDMNNDKQKWDRSSSIKNITNKKKYDSCSDYSSTHTKSVSSLLLDDCFPNINVKSLKNKYLQLQFDEQSYNNNDYFRKENQSSYPMSINKSISVKHLCRSFGDLTTFNDVKNKENQLNNTNYLFNFAKSVADLRKLEQIPIYTGVSVKNLRDSYCNLVGLNESSYMTKRSSSNICSDENFCSGNNNNNLFINHLYESNNRKSNLNRLTFGIKQFEMKTSFSIFDALQKKNLLNVRSTETPKIQENLNGTNEVERNCQSCNKIVFQMEQVKAEKNIWHKNCFRCVECSKQLNIDTYQSNDGILYCKLHFKALFTPKAVEDNGPVKPRKHEMIIRENKPRELPADVVRSSDKPDLGLEELQSLNVKERFQVFEHPNNEIEPVIAERNTGVKRSTSILSKLAMFQAKGMDCGVNDEDLNGIEYEVSIDGESDNEDDDENVDRDLIRAKRMQKEKPITLSNMNEVKTKFETGHSMTKEERREERKQEIQSIRSRLFMGKQAKIKEMYQQAVLDSEQGVSTTKHKADIEIGDKARSIKERFEKGEAFIKKNVDDDGVPSQSRIQDDEQNVFEQGISRKSRSIFMEMDATSSKSPSSSGAITPRTPEIRMKNLQPHLNLDDVVKCDDKQDDVKIETAEISSKFKFFETYKPEEKQKREFRITPPRDGVVKLGSPEREVYRDPHVARADMQLDDPIVAENSHTATKMLSIFRQMEEKKRDEPHGLKPLKRFTPPPDEGRRVFNNDSESDGNYTSSEESDSEEDDDEDEKENNNDDRTNKYEDEFLKQAQSAERAKQLRAKFEKWEINELKREQLDQNNSAVNLYDQSNDESQIESAKSIRAKFESMRGSDDVKEKRNRAHVNRFV